jgi:diguanylate cyclase (GGDEF)-like protein
MTERRHAEEHALARTDELTGLVNRRGLYEALDGALEPGAPPLAVLLADLDGFKQVNDTHGHAAGDLLLREVADRLVAASPTGALVARLGGDEFAVLVAGADAGRAGAALAVRLAAAVERPVDVGGAQVVVRASVGVAVADGAAPVPRGDLLHRADLAMYAAKHRPPVPAPR